MAEYKGFSSRRQYRNYVSRLRGWSSESQRQRFSSLEAHDPEAYARALGYEARDGNSAEITRIMYWEGAQRSRDLKGFRSWAAAAERRGVDRDVFERQFNRARRGDWNRSPNGEFAKLLAMVGYRDPDSDKDVGDS